jgi:hypothetical protein
MDGQFRHQAHCPFRAGDLSTRVGVGLLGVTKKSQNTRAPRASVSQSAGDADASIPIFKDGNVCVAQRLHLRRAATPTNTGCSLWMGVSMLNPP